MENRRPMIIGITCFLVSLLLIWAYTTVKYKEMTSQFGDEVNVVVAAKSIEEYKVIQNSDLKVITVFKNFRQPQTVTSPNEIVGKAAYVPIYEGEQVTMTKLVHSDGKPVLDRQVEPKMRAVTIQVAPQTGVGKLIRPGNRVDIIAVVSYDQSGSLQFESRTVFQNILVLATGKTVQNSIPTRVNRETLTQIEATFEQEKRKDLYNTSLDSGLTSRPDDSYQTITVQLTPEDAEKMIFLQHTIGDNRIFFTLRNGGDTTVAKLDSTILDAILGPDSDYGRSRVKPPPMNPPKPRFFDVKGGEAIPVGP